MQNRESKLSTINNLTQQWITFIAMVAENGELADIWSEGLKGTNLPTGKEVRFRALAGSYFLVLQGFYLQQIDDRLDPRIWTGLRMVW